MTEEQIPEGFRIVKIKPEEAPWKQEEQSKTAEVAAGARAVIIEWLNNPAKVLYWHGSGDGNIDEAPIIAPIIAHLKESYPVQSKRIQENPYLSPMDLVVTEAPGLAAILTIG
jgi:hypothetical protein